MNSHIERGANDCINGAVSALAVANRFIELANAVSNPVSNMKLQKLVFLAHGHCLALFDRPLYFEDTRAWQWGPVIPQLYKKLQKYGRGAVIDFLETKFVIPEDSEEDQLIKVIWDVYGCHTAAALSRLTHQPDAPWKYTWDHNPFGVIPQDDIKSFYKSLVEAAS